MERVPKPFLILAIFLIAFLTTSTTAEAGRDIPSDNEVPVDPQSLSASSPSFDPSSFPRYPNWFGGFKGTQASSKDKPDHDSTRGPYGDDRSLSNQQWDLMFPWGPWFWGIHGSKEAGIDKNHKGLYDARFPFFHHWDFSWSPWFWGIHGSKAAGIDKNQKGLYDTRFPIFHHWDFPRWWSWSPWFGGIKAEAMMKEMAMGGHGYGDHPPKAADGSKVAAGETP